MGQHSVRLLLFRRRLDARVQETVSHIEFAKNLSLGHVEVTKHYYTNTPIADIFKQTRLSLLPPEKVKRAHFYADLFNAFLRRKAENRRSVSTSDEKLNVLLPLLADDIRNLWPLKKPRPGVDTKGEMELPSTNTSLR